MVCGVLRGLSDRGWQLPSGRKGAVRARVVGQALGTADIRSRARRRRGPRALGDVSGDWVPPSGPHVSPRQLSGGTLPERRPHPHTPSRSFTEWPATQRRSSRCTRGAGLRRSPVCGGYTGDEALPRGPPASLRRLLPGSEAGAAAPGRRYASGGRGGPVTHPFCYPGPQQCDRHDSGPARLWSTRPRDPDLRELSPVELIGS